MKKKFKDSEVLSGNFLRQLFFIMKLTLFFLITSTLGLFATGSYSQNTRITLDLRSVPVREALKAIENESEFFFIYNNELINVDREININVKNQKITEVLNNIFEGRDVEITVIDRKIVLAPAYMGEQQSNRKINGKVTDSSGATLPGVSVVLKGTSTGVITDSNGNYLLAGIPENAILQFSFVGMKMQEIAVGSKTTINVTLIEETVGIEEVVAIGYGTKLRKDLTTAVSSVDGELIKSIPTLSVGQAMVGKMAGVTLQQAGGDPGSAPVIRIRGAGSITLGNSPLYVIDGYPTNDGSLFNAIPPSDIENINILKDAASSAIYGSRAGNGVILITTKRGKSGKTQFNVDVTQGFETITKKYKVLDANQYIDMVKNYYANQPTPAGQVVPAFFNDPTQWTPTDWQDQIFRTASYKNYQIGATGGTDKLKYSVSGGYTNQEGVVKHSGLERYNFRFNLDANLTNKLKIGASIQPSYSITQNQNTSGANNPWDVSGIIYKALTMPPILPVYKANGDYYVINQQPAPIPSILNNQLYNPVNNLDANKSFTKALRFTGTTYIEWEPVANLKAKTSVNLGFINQQMENYVEPFASFQSQASGNISTPNYAAISASRVNNSFLNWYISNTLTYKKTIEDDHSFSGLLGYDIAKQGDFGTSVFPRTDQSNPIAFDSDLIKNVQGAILTQGSSFKQVYVFDAIFGRLEYNFKSKYLLTGSLRRDRSSRFGPDSRAGFFPSVSAAWRAKEESFLNNLELLSDLKIRGSYGETGNDQFSGYYPWVGSVSKGFYTFGGVTDARVLGYNLSGFSNTQLGWEKNKQVDVGLDLGLLKNRVMLTIDAYERNSNSILQTPVPSINGIVSSILQNVGNIQNRGLEVTLDTRNLTGEFRWNTNANITFNQNKITKLGPNQTQLANLAGAAAPGDWTQIMRNIVGRPMGDIYMYDVIGTFNNATDVATYPKFGTQGIGDLRYRDVSGPAGVPDGKIDANDMTYVGNYQPKFTYNMTNSFSFKGFDFSFVFQGSYGGKIVEGLGRGLGLFRNLENAGIEALDRWKSEAEPGNGFNQKAGSPNLGSNIGPSTRFLYSASFLRLRNITFAYTIPSAIVKKASLQTARVYLTAQNVLTISKLPGYNPEPNYYGDNALQNGVDMGTYPVTRNISLGISLGF